MHVQAVVIIALTLMLTSFSSTSHAGGDFTEQPLPGTWQGFYFGGHLGGSFSDGPNEISDILNYAKSIVEPDDNIEIDDDFDGLTGGGHVGINFQAGKVVFGVEGDASFTTSELSFERTNVVGDPIESGKLELEQSYLASLRLRLGLALERTLLYATGGVAFTELDVGYEMQNDLVNESFSESETYTGFVVGGGGEHKLGDNVSLRAEALYYNFDEDYVELDEIVVRGGLTWHVN